MIRVSIDGLEQVQRALDALPLKSQAAVDAFAQFIYDRARSGADKHTKTGALVRSLTLRPLGKGGWEIGHDLRHAPHALFVHWGAKPHVIRPKKRKALRRPAGNGFVFARWANHPGYQGDPWLIHATRAGIRNFDAIARSAFRA
jgi:hypothetical protein